MSDYKIRVRDIQVRSKKARFGAMGKAGKKLSRVVDDIVPGF